MAQKLNLNEVSHQGALDVLESLREGRTTSLDGLKTSAIIDLLVKKVNELCVENEAIKAELARTQKSNRTIKRKIKKTIESR